MPDQNDITFSQYSLDWNGLFIAIFKFFGASDISAGGVLNTLETLWGVFVALSLLLAALFFAGFVYASIRYNQLAAEEIARLHEQEQLWQELYGQPETSRLKDIVEHVASDNPNDWKLAIIEADIELQRVLDEAGYPGNTIGEMLKAANQSTFRTLEDAWEAHKVRNRIAHDGADFVLTKRLAQETITRYQRVFDEFGYR